ncbi:hypothetical protein, partial [Enterobacter hormaechei]
IADPDGGRNIRLKGAIYEQSFNAGEGLRAAIESAAAEYRRDAESRIPVFIHISEPTRHNY